MSSYIIAGSADKEETGECEVIANRIKSFYKNIDFRIIIKHPKEWNEYIHEICRIYGFKKPYNPIIYTLDGKIIGNKKDFIELSEKTFGIDLANLNKIPTSINMKIVEKEVAHKKKKNKGKKTLDEKIQFGIWNKYQDKIINPSGGVYKIEYNCGLQFFSKIDPKLCPIIPVQSEYNAKLQREDVYEADIDLNAIAAKDYYPPEQPEEANNSEGNPENQEGNQQPVDPNQPIQQNTNEQAQSNQQNPQTVEIPQVNTTQQTSQQDNTIIQNSDKKEGQINQPPVQQGEVTKDQVQQQVQNESSNTQNPTSEVQKQEQKEPQKDAPKDGQKEEQKEGQKEGQKEEQKEGQKSELQSQKDTPKEEKSEEDSNLLNMADEFIQADLQNMNNFIIKKLKDNYYIACHPQPLIDGQCILFEGMTEKENEQDVIKIRDYSKQLRNRKIRPKKQNEQDEILDLQKLAQNQDKSLQEQGAEKKLTDLHPQEDKKQEEENQNQSEQKGQKEDSEQGQEFQSRLNLDMCELAYPFSKKDLQKIKMLVKKLDCVVTYQMLPFGVKSHMKLSSNLINVYLKTLLDTVTSNQGIMDAFKLCQQLDYNPQLEPQTKLQHLPFEKYILQLEGQNVSVEEVKEKYIKIPNLQFEHLIYLFKSKIKTKDIRDNYAEMIETLFTKEELLSAGVNVIITKEFMMLVPLFKPYMNFKGVDLWIEPISYLGFLHLPEYTKLWPTTAFDLKSLYKQPLQYLIDSQIRK